MPVLETEEKIYLQQIFTNLIGNAIKYHDQASGNVKIGWLLMDNFIRFSVTDDGPGILPQYQEKILRSSTLFKERLTETAVASDLPLSSRSWKKKRAGYG